MVLGIYYKLFIAQILHVFEIITNVLMMVFLLIIGLMWLSLCY